MFLGRSDDQRLFDAGRQALAAGNVDEAIATFERFMTRVDSSSSAWFNLGLAYKLKGDWANSARCNRKAVELDGSNQEASWNLGVASTAMRDWNTARWAWQRIGVDPGPGDGPPELDLGQTPIRLGPDGDGEVVWGTRIDPCRARLVSVPLPESRHRWGDVILHDVVPRGQRTYGERTWSVFDELPRMDASDVSTFEAGVVAPTDADSVALESLIVEQHHLGAEDWTRLRWLCAQCSLSHPHEHRSGGEIAPMWVETRRFGLAGPRDDLVRLLSAWAGQGAGRSFSDPIQVL